MKSTPSQLKGLLFGCLALSVFPAALQAATTNFGYLEMDLVSDISSNAPHTDSRLVNPWGIVAGKSAVWLNDNGPGLTTEYGPLGRPSRFAINIPGPGGSGSGTPSGLVFNETRAFVLTNGLRSHPSTFLMSTEDGTIAAWNEKISGSNATLVVDNSAAGTVYKGLAIALDTNGAPNIYAADFHQGHLDQFNANFQFIQSFTDTNVPALFAPFNVRNVRGRLFVTFAKQRLPEMHDDDAGPGNGFIDIFDTDGTLLRRFASQGVLNSPWGMVTAPLRFGRFSRALLVGNFGDGRINAFDLLTGKPLGNLTRPDGTDLTIEGLWGLSFEQEEQPDRDCEFQAQRLYFSAGINSEADGLMGFIRPVFPFAHQAR